MGKMYDPSLYLQQFGTGGAVGQAATNVANASPAVAAQAPTLGAQLYPAPTAGQQLGSFMQDPDKVLALAGVLQGIGSLLSVGNPKAEAISGLAGQQLQQAAGANSLNSMKPTGIQPPAAQPTALTQPVAQSQAAAAQPQTSALTQPVAGSYLTGNPTTGSGPTGVGSVPFPKISMYMSPEAQQMAMRSYAMLQGQELDKAQVVDQQQRTGLMSRDQALKERLAPTAEEAALERKADLEYKNVLTQDIKSKPAAREDEQAHDMALAQKRFELTMQEAQRKLELDKQFETFKLDLARSEQQVKSAKQLTPLDKAKLVSDYVDTRAKLTEFGADDPVVQQNLRMLDAQMRLVMPDLEAQLAPPTREEMGAQLRAARPDRSPEDIEKALDQWFPRVTAGGEQPTKAASEASVAKQEKPATTTAKRIAPPRMTARTATPDPKVRLFTEYKAKYPKAPPNIILEAISKASFRPMDTLKMYATGEGATLDEATANSEREKRIRTELDQLLAPYKK